jgi:hypothetical protein
MCSWPTWTPISSESEVCYKTAASKMVVVASQLSPRSVALRLLPD